MTTERREMVRRLAAGPIRMSEIKGVVALNALSGLSRQGVAEFSGGAYHLVSLTPFFDFVLNNV